VANAYVEEEEDISFERLYAIEEDVSEPNRDFLDSLWMDIHKDEQMLEDEECLYAID